MTADDDRWMSRCLELARGAAGRVSPNPMVGSVIVDTDGALLGEGRHEVFGGPHAERNAIADAVRRGNQARLRGATIYVNLEPCNHHGKTPPCTDAILEAGIGRVVVGMVDENPLVAGTGLERLRANGIDVAAGILERECRRLNEAFSHHMRTGRPLITLKIAQSLDGRIATASGDSKWISGLDARTRVHQWRSEMDAVLVGSGTATADDPALTVRHVEGRQPYRVVLDREGRLPMSLKLFSDAQVARTIAVISNEAPAPSYAHALEAAGGRLLRSPITNGHIDLEQLFATLGAGSDAHPPIQSIMVEAGPSLATALLRQDLVDRLFLFIAPMVIGHGKPSVADLQIERVADALRFADVEWEQVGNDMLMRGFRRRP